MAPRSTFVFVLLVSVLSLAATLPAEAGIGDWYRDVRNSCRTAFDRGSRFARVIPSMRLSNQPLSLPPLEEPIRLEHPMPNPPGFGHGPEALMMTYTEFPAAKEQKAGESAGKTLWETRPLGEFAAQTGMRVIKSRIYEAFGFQTAQARIADVHGETRVLEKRLDGWRKKNGAKIENYPSLELEPPSSPEFRALRFVAILLGDTHLLIRNTARAGDDFMLNEFSPTLGTTNGTLQGLMTQVSVHWLPIQHPWRTSIRNVDVEKFKAKLSRLTDSLIQRIVRSGHTGDPDFEAQLIGEIIRRRDLLLSDWDARDLPGASPPDLLQARTHLPAVLFENHHVKPLTELNRIRLEELKNLERVLKGFIDEEATSSDELAEILRQFELLAVAGLRELPTDLWFEAFQRAVEIASRREHPRALDISRLGARIFSAALKHSQASILEAFETNLPETYALNPNGLMDVLKERWVVPNDIGYLDSSLNNFGGEFSKLLSSEKNRTAEILLISLIMKSVDQAEIDDRTFEQTGQLYNALRVRVALQFARSAIAIFENLKFPRSALTRDLDFDKVKRLFRALEYNEAGKREYAQLIRPRVDLNVYNLLRAYVAKQSNILPTALVSLGRDK